MGIYLAARPSHRSVLPCLRYNAEPRERDRGRPRIQRTRNYSRICSVHYRLQCLLPPIGQVSRTAASRHHDLLEGLRGVYRESVLLPRTRRPAYAIW